MGERSLRVLLIEDDPDDYLITRDLLAETEGLKIDLEWASTFEQGLEAVRGCRHDVFLVDYFLGPHTGTELLREAATVACRAPIIMLTGQASQEADAQAMQVGAAEFLVKGFLNAGALERTIRHALERKRAEQEQQLLAEAGQLLAGSLDYATTLASIARLVVPALADSCVIDLPDAQGELQRAVAVCSDPERERLLHELRLRFPLRRIASHPARRVLESGESLLFPAVTPEMMHPLGDDPEELEMLQRIQPSSCMLVPIVSRKRTFGVLTLGRYGAQRRFDERDLHLAEELGRRSAMAVDNARLYREAQETEEQLRRHATRLQVLAEASKLFTEARLDRTAVLNSMLELVASVIGDGAVARLLSDEELHLTPVAICHRDARVQRELERTLLAESHIATEGRHAEVVRSGQPLLVPVASSPREHPDARGDPEHAATDRFAVHSLLIVPLRASGRTIGTLELRRDHPGDPYSLEDQVLVQELADRAGQAIDNATLYEEAQRALKTRDEVLAIVSHDLRDPLSTIRMSGWMLADMELSPDQRRTQAEVIGRAAQRAERLIQDLLDVARMEAGRFSVETASTEILPLITETCDPLRARAATAGVSLKYQIPDDMRPVVADRHRILQLLSNLVGNAIKFTPAGGTISIHGAEEGREARFWVRNTGDGIPAEELPHLFDRFWQARRANRAGAGLGLAICRGIVEAHGGRIWVESEPGSHATFFFTLPIAAAGGRNVPPGGGAEVEVEIAPRPGAHASPGLEPQRQGNP